MKKHIQTLYSLGSKKVLDTSQYLFGRGNRLSTLIALLLTLAAPAAKAVDLGDLGNAANFICLIQAYVSGPVLFGLGIVLIIVGAVAIANSESNIGKMISSVIVGLGIASCALPLVKNQLKINYTCA
ncbi:MULTISPECIES: TrbC/VirB2 family protein [unclassified Burkholderia]|uniref:TrbC/VirB2 family protein n=1 Tax=unclassified Burkholderia TaxID=2613784 RepID=UPI00075A3444|nr:MULTISPECIES: TrbC/VirB2 family protein [unclassified Burkholderia]AXK67997.1 conjugal transfer protein TrbC [Burkholderia sp. IDO3]KUY85894.1 conjugal transfer protein TrbC [Burkholderia sp. RF4-BP95]KUY92766.1 conjugal transfer protein TrbC [Burkholderia sp. RF7-non_BP4]KUY95275.1 conjugal transfer protein TrbC [Burkholderia sp. RF7-non_BP1]MCR4470109.1 TrbC/VirB2 family protein [Burkholderia sp. SCN-KJ]